MSKNVLFYSSVCNKKLFNTQKFYQIDISLLRELGYNVILSNSISDAFFFWRYDFVFAYFYKKSFFVALIAFIFWKDTYFTGGIDSLDKSYASRKDYIIQKWLVRFCYLIAKSCFIVSKSDLDNVRKIIYGFTKKLAYSEHTIDTDKFVIPFTNKEHYFTTIAWMGTEGNVRRKGLDIALKLFSCIKKEKKFEDYKFIIIGKKGAGTPYLESLIFKYGISKSVILTDEISEDSKIDYLKRSKYYFQLSLYEGFGVAALEALVARNIVIHSGKGGLANPIFKDGILFNIDNFFSTEYTSFFSKLNDYKIPKMEGYYEQIISYYSNSRRKEDFKRIINL